MKNKAKGLVAGLAAVATGFAFAPAVSADDPRTVLKKVDPELGDPNLMSTAKTVMNAAIGLIAMLAVFMIVYGGFQYTASAGDANKITKAKNTILYGVIGLVIAILAFAIVNFVLDKVLT